ncbi:MAG: ABC transporter ATP-binding protein [Ignavibacteriae bacterium]|nr:ABC transporter ATP-binding protein [Ignavibacteriota bacterium]
MPAVEMHNITKRFGIIKANDAVDFSVDKGEIHALVGENGAGKTTLMKILYGMYQPNEGKIFINNRQETVSSPAIAIAKGIGMVHQHFMLIPTLTVTENIVLGNEPTLRFDLIDLRRAQQELQKLTETYHLIVDLQAKVETLSVGMQQRVEILKMLYRNADILILDEPTAVLTPQEVEELFNTLSHFKNQCKTIILITHKLSEVMAISDRVTVMRHGQVVACVETKLTNQVELARMMVGKEMEGVIVGGNPFISHPVVVVEQLAAMNDKKLSALHDVSFTISEGEILGIAAIEGNGQAELVQVIAGLRKIAQGSIKVNNQVLNDSNRRTLIAHIPEDRTHRGLVLDFTVAENLILGRHYEPQYSKRFLFHQQTIVQFAETMIQEHDIRPRDKDLVMRHLSGGNQQKTIVARELSKNAPVIIAHQPTRGLDIGATEFVHTALLSERDHGKAILLVSSDLTELLTLADRIAVMYEGHIVTVLNAKDTSERELGMYMTGVIKKVA